ncbi:MAG: hypothetical protein KA116_08925 [Proteobacteria bacterium]|nr:hypothetical protein [Pseudomonadota bacterium]
MFLNIYKTTFLSWVLLQSFIVFSAPEMGDADFHAFKYSLGLQKFEASAASDSTSPLNKMAIREMIARGWTEQELYDRYVQLLEKLKAPLTKVLLIQQALQREEFGSNAQSFEVGLVGGFAFFGFSMRVGLGRIRTPAKSFPVFSFRAMPQTSGLTFGAALQVGVSKEAKNQNELWAIAEGDVNQDTSSNRSFGLVAGKYEVNLEQKHQSQGMLLGLIGAENRASMMTLRLVLPWLYYKYPFSRIIGTKMTELLMALYSFDFSLSELKIKEFENLVLLQEKKMLERGLEAASLSGSIDFTEHPFSSPGALFHLKTVAKNAPQLLGEEMRALVCENFLDPKNKSRGIKKQNLLLGE